MTTVTKINKLLWHRRRGTQRRSESSVASLVWWWPWLQYNVIFHITLYPTLHGTFSQSINNLKMPRSTRKLCARCFSQSVNKPSQLGRVTSQPTLLYKHTQIITYIYISTNPNTIITLHSQYLKFCSLSDIPWRILNMLWLKCDCFSLLILMAYSQMEETITLINNVLKVYLQMEKTTEL